MSWTDKELSEMAKAAQAEQKFAYQDSFWGEVEAMLPAKKKRAFPFFWLIAIPVVAAAGYMAFSSTQNRVNPTQVAKTMKLETPTVLITNDASIEKEVSAKEPTKHPYRNVTQFLNNSARQTKLKALNMGENSTTGIKSDVKESIPSLTLPTSSLVKKAKAQTIFSENQDLSIQKPKTLGKTLLTYPSLESNRINSGLAISPSLLEKKAGSSFSEPIELLPLLSLNLLARTSIPTISPLLSRKRSNFWNGYVEGGFTMGQSFASPQVGHTTAYNLGFGARYDFANYFFQFGLGGEIQNVKYEMNEREKIYHTSSTVFENIFSYKQLYRFEAPITFGYQFPKHVVQLSVIPAYLMGAKMKYTYLENGSMLRDETLYETEHGKKVAWNDFSTTFALGYGYRLTKTMTLGANVRWQLMNQLNTTTEGGNVRPFSGQIFFRKTLR